MKRQVWSTTRLCFAQYTNILRLSRKTAGTALSGGDARAGKGFFDASRQREMHVDHSRSPERMIWFHYFVIMTENHA
jgi:hypothetical protein